MLPCRSIWTPDRKKTSSLPRCAKSKNSFEPTNGTAPSTPGSRKRSRGAWLRWASRTPAAGIGEFTPIPTRSPSWMARAIAHAINSSSVYKDQRVHECRRKHLLLCCEAGCGVLANRADRVDDPPRGLGHQSIVVRRADHHVPGKVRAAPVQQGEVGPDGRHENDLLPRPVGVVQDPEVGTPAQQIAAEQTRYRRERDAGR